MPRTTIAHPAFAHIQARAFFETYAPGVKRFYHKLRGVDSQGKPLGFTQQDKEVIREGMSRMADDAVKNISK